MRDLGTVGATGAQRLASVQIVVVHGDVATRLVLGRPEAIAVLPIALFVSVFVVVQFREGQAMMLFHFQFWVSFLMSGRV
ncbi:hypothetical protein A7M48_23255 [Acinetobacter baumannii]|nr:hypothetical protein A7M48_23255 [Acinetobacter baumannii]